MSSEDGVKMKLRVQISHCLVDNSPEASELGICGDKGDVLSRPVGQKCLE